MPGSVRTSCSRPGPNPTSVTGVPNLLGDELQVLARLVRELRERAAFVEVLARVEVFLPPAHLAQLRGGVVQHGLVVGGVVEHRSVGPGG